MSVYDSGRCNSKDINPTEGRLVIKDTLGGNELLALVFPPECSTTPDITNMFIAAPGLVEACEKLSWYTDKIEHYLDFSYVEREDRKAILMALAEMRMHLKKALEPVE